MHDLGFYQIYELNVDFVERVREEITPLFDAVPDGNQKEHYTSETRGSWGNGHYPLQDCGPWTQKFIGLFNNNFLANLRMSKFTPTNSYDWHIGIESQNDFWDKGEDGEEPEIYPYQVKGTTLNIMCSPCIGDKTMFASEMSMRKYRGMNIGYGKHDTMLVVDEFVVDRNPCLLNTQMFHKISATGTRNMASFVFSPYVSFATAVAYAKEIGILIPRTDGGITPYMERDRLQGETA